MEEGWPIPESDFAELRSSVLEALRRDHPELDQLEIGASFPPIEWEVPTRPEGKVFWAALEGPILAADLADALKSLGATGAHLIPVDGIRSGERSPEEEPPIPDSGEPEDLLDLATKSHDDSQNFSFLSVVAEGRLNASLREHLACPGCGFVQVDRERGWRIWQDDMSPGCDFFHYPTTLWIIVTNRVADLLRELAVKNVELIPLEPGRPVPEVKFPEV